MAPDKPGTAPGFPADYHAEMPGGEAMDRESELRERALALLDQAETIFIDLEKIFGAEQVRSLWAKIPTKRPKGRKKGAKSYKDEQAINLIQDTIAANRSIPKYRVIKSVAQKLFDENGRIAGASAEAIAKRLSRRYEVVERLWAEAIINYMTAYPQRRSPLWDEAWKVIRARGQRGSRTKIPRK